jgi:hypothetical protein
MLLAGLLPLLLLVPLSRAPAQSPPAPGDPALVGLDHFVGEPYVVSVGDVDQDGIPDLLVQLGYLWQQARLELLRGRGDGSFEPSEPVQGYVHSGHRGFIRFVHADGDGILDLVEFLGGIDKSRVFLGVGDGSFQPPHMMPGRNLLRDADHFATADFNLDGRQDLVVTGQAGSVHGGTVSTTVFVYFGGPGGAYAGPEGGTIGQFSGLGGLVTGDFDEDGWPDVLASVWPASSHLPPAGLWLWSGPGSGAPVVPTVVTPLDTFPRSLVTSDFDGDGHLDVAALDALPGTEQQAVRVLLGDGTGLFSTAGWLVVDAPTDPANQLGARLLKADVDADGLVDLVAVPEVSTTLSLFRGLGGAQFAPATTHPISDATSPGWFWRQAETADLDGDGRGDVVVSHVLQPTVRTLLAGTAPFVSLGLGQPDPQLAPVLAGSGSTLPGGTVQVDLSGVPPGTHGLLLVDLTTSVERALGLSVALPQGPALPAAGNTTWHAAWPDGLEPGTPIYVQAVLLGPAGYSTSNVLALLAEP